MKAALMTVSLLIATHLCHAQRFFEPTNGSSANPNLSVETYQDFVVAGFTETNPNTGLLCPAFKITDLSGTPLAAFYVDFPDAMYLMDFTVREATGTVILTGMTAVTNAFTPHKMFVAEVDFFTGTTIQSYIEYTVNGNTMIPQQVIHSEATGQVTIVGTETAGWLTAANYVSIPKYGFVLGLDINDYSNILYQPVETDTPPGMADYDMLENLTEVPGVGYFISGSANGPSGEQNLLTMGLDYGGNVIWSNVIDNTNFREAGSSVMYNANLNVVYLMVNNSALHQFQVALCDGATGAFLTSWISQQIIGLPIGGGADQNGFRLQQTPDNVIMVAGYVSLTTGAVPQLIPYQIVMKENLAFIAGKLYMSDNHSPLSPGYFEENGNSTFINTPDMFVYSDYANRTYIVNQNDLDGGYDLYVSPVFDASICEKKFDCFEFSVNPVIVGTVNVNPLPMYPAGYSPNVVGRPFTADVLCWSAPAAIQQSVLSPNPATNELQITLEDGASIKNVTVYDLNGAIVLTQEATARSYNEITLNVAGLKAGAYMIVITTTEGINHRERFVKA
jgi:hypothetical protein